MKNTGTLIIIAIIIATITGMLFLTDHYRNEHLAEASKEMKGKNLLQVIIDSTKGQDPFFNASLKGKIVVVSVWTAVFPPCRAQVPQLNNLVKNFNSDKVVFVAIDPGDSANETAVLKDKDIHFDYHILFRRSDLMQLFISEKPVQEGVSSQANIPANIVINPEGGIEFYYTGNHAGQIDEISNYLANATGKISH